MRWSDFAARAPRLAALGEDRLLAPGVVLVGTIRRDGTPRISPVEPLLWNGDLWLSMLLGSYKAEDDRQIQAGYAGQARERLGWSPDPGRFHLFRVELEDVAFIRYEDASGDQFVSRWPSGREYVRRGTSATSLGPPELRRDLLDGP